MSGRQQDKYHWRFPGGESYADADHRAARALGQIAGQRVRRALIVSHEMIGRLLMATSSPPIRRRHWDGTSPMTSLTRSIPGSTWPFEGILAAIERGTLPDWRRLAASIRADP